MTNDRGFTLAELLAVCAVIALLMAGVFLTLEQGQSAYLFGAGRVEVQQNARVALDRVLRELRTATLVTTAAANDVKFTYLDGTNTLVTVEYSLSGTSLQRNQTVPALGGQPAVLVGGVGGFAVTYYDITDVAGATAANTRAVDIQIITQAEDTSLATYSPAHRSVIVQGRVKLRNE
jgi:prepilin-type N-terminal cleavage/methylation domain-containing protein